MDALGLLMEDSKVTKSLSNHDLSFVRLPCVSSRGQDHQRVPTYCVLEASE